MYGREQAPKSAVNNFSGNNSNSLVVQDNRLGETFKSGSRE